MPRLGKKRRKRRSKRRSKSRRRSRMSRNRSKSKPRKQNWVSSKIRKLKKEGYPQKQAVAIALSMWSRKYSRPKRRKSRKRSRSRRRKNKRKPKQRGHSKRRALISGSVSAGLVAGAAAASVVPMISMLVAKNHEDVRRKFRVGRLEPKILEKGVRTCEYPRQALRNVMIDDIFRIRVISREIIPHILYSRIFMDDIQHHYIEIESRNNKDGNNKDEPCTITFGITLNQGKVLLDSPDYILEEATKKLKKQTNGQDILRKMRQYRLTQLYNIPGDVFNVQGKAVFEGKINDQHIKFLLAMEKKLYYTRLELDSIKFSYFNFKCSPNRQNCRSFAHMFAHSPEQLRKAVFGE